MTLENLGRIDIEILKFVSEKGEVRYTDLRAYLEKQDVCSEKTFVSHKTKLEAENLLGKKLSKKTGGPVYVIPFKIRKKVASYFKRQEMKSKWNRVVDSASEKEFEALRRQVAELKRQRETEIKSLRHEVAESRKVLSVLRNPLTQAVLKRLAEEEA